MVKETDKDIEPIKLLWTGGWDSTFRLLYILSECDAYVEPHYIISVDRASAFYEVRAMKAILESIGNKNKEWSNRILSSVIVFKHEVSIDAKLRKMFESLQRISYLGSQYEILASYAKSRDIKGLELTIHKDDKATLFIKKNVVEEIKYGLVNFKVDPSSIGELYFFSFFHFPLLNWTKKDMHIYSIKKGFSDIMNNTWFCHNPIKGQPCGVCNPCVYSIEEEMEFRFKRKALLRYKLLSTRMGSNNLVRRILRKI